MKGGTWFWAVNNHNFSYWLMISIILKKFKVQRWWSKSSTPLQVFNSWHWEMILLAMISLLSDLNSYAYKLAPDWRRTVKTKAVSLFEASPSLKPPPLIHLILLVVFSWCVLVCIPLPPLYLNGPHLCLIVSFPFPRGFKPSSRHAQLPLYSSILCPCSSVCACLCCFSSTHVLWLV